WRLRLLQGLPRRAADARCEDHPDLGRNEPDPPPADRAKLRAQIAPARAARFRGRRGLMNVIATAGAAGSSRTRALARRSVVVWAAATGLRQPGARRLDPAPGPSRLAAPRRGRRRGAQDRAAGTRRRDALVRAEVRSRQRELRAPQPRQALDRDRP